MNLIPSSKVFAALLAIAASATAARAELIHRYSFNDGAAKDSVGKIEASLKGPGASIADGKLVIKNDEAASLDKLSYLEFASSVLPKDSKSASILVWFTAKEVAAFARVLDIGASEDGEGMKFIYFSPRTGDGTARVAITGSDVSSKTNVDSEALDDGKPHLVAIVIDGEAKKLRVFVDGKEPSQGELLGDNTLDKVKPVESKLGKSAFTADAGLNGAIDEFRVYSHAVTADEAAAIFKTGPDALPAAAK